MQVGFFADAGPLQLFVSNHLIPEDFSFDSANEPAFVSSDEAVRVQAGAEVRLRIVGTRVDADEIVSLDKSPAHSSLSCGLSFLTGFQLMLYLQHPHPWPRMQARAGSCCSRYLLLS